MNTPAAKKALSGRLQSLQAHLKAENQSLLGIVPAFFKLDKLLYATGLLDRSDSLATRIPWWPLISVLGTFSSGKSTFINAYVGQKIQSTGNQAVDDMFTVICYGPSGQDRVLPGMALDADPRFPFYRMSAEIENVVAGEGKRIDSYLQLKTSGDASMKGKIIIDSPGFDADDQRRSTLKITDHIIDLSDLVLVFFDARHPEPGAMQDTLQHLVAGTINRSDSAKFLYILNQIDTTAREDNPEEVIAAWQRAIAQAGLAAGRFYCIYDEAAAVPIEDEALRARYQSKRDADLGEIRQRINDLEIERNYRIIGVLETVATEVERELVPMLGAALDKWRRRVMIGDAIWLASIAALAVGVAAKVPAITWTAIGDLLTKPLELGLSLMALAGVFLAGHYWVRSIFARSIAKKLPERVGQMDLQLRAAFARNTRVFHSVFRKSPVGWGRRALDRLAEVRADAAAEIQKLNDFYTDPSGRRTETAAAPKPETPAITKADIPKPALTADQVADDAEAGKDAE